jgi:hypothetical protein
VSQNGGEVQRRSLRVRPVDALPSAVPPPTLGGPPQADCYDFATIAANPVSFR